MQVLKNPHVIPPATDLALVKETALRRQLKADLTEINLIIKNFNKNDFLTEAVKIWYDFFCKSLETNQDIDNIYRKHLESLQLILADFSDEVFLGNATPRKRSAYLSIPYQRPIGLDPLTI